MTMTANDSQPYASLEALQQASDALIASLPDDDSPVSDSDRDAISKRIALFIDQATMTGTVLDASDDRKASQALIDFWVAKSYAIPGETRTKQRASAKANTLLRPFDPTTVTSAIQDGDALLALLGEKDRDLARRILLAMVRIGDTDETSASVSVKRKDLVSLGPSPRVNDILKALINSGVVIVSGHEPEELIGLRSGSLIRQWPQLNKLIDERISYRNMALNWEQTGKRSGTLLDWSTTKKFKSFGNLNETERTFIGASEDYNAKVYGWRSAGLVGLFVLVAIIFLFPAWKKSRTYADHYGPGIVASVNAGPTRTAADIRWVADNPQWLVDNNKTIDIRTGSIENVDLSGLSLATAPHFSDVTIKNVTFDRANLPAVTFSKATIADVAFREANLNSSTFRDSTTLTRTSFNKANLSKATFGGVRFCAGVDFSDANVARASFESVTFFNNNVPPNMKNTAWWLASDWTEDQRTLLAGKYPKEEIEGSWQLQKELSDIQRNLDGVESALKDDRLVDAGREALLERQANWMNDKAWTFAKYGVIRPKEDPKLDGEKLARDSIRIAEELNSKPDRNPRALARYRKLRAEVSDTLAYIIIQRERSPSQKLDEAIDRLEFAKDVLDDKEVYFKLAIALSIANKDDSKAATYFEKSVLEQRYVPTHELYLLAEFIPKTFWEIMARSKTAKATAGETTAVDPGVLQKDNNPCGVGQSSQNSN
jgi:hypothetical protein